MTATEKTVCTAREDNSTCRYIKSLGQLSHSYWEPVISMRFACESKRYRSNWQSVLYAYGVNYNWSVGQKLDTLNLEYEVYTYRKTWQRPCKRMRTLHYIIYHRQIILYSCRPFLQIVTFRTRWPHALAEGHDKRRNIFCTSVQSSRIAASSYSETQR